MRRYGRRKCAVDEYPLQIYCRCILVPAYLAGTDSHVEGDEEVETEIAESEGDDMAEKDPKTITAAEARAKARAFDPEGDPWVQKQLAQVSSAVREAALIGGGRVEVGFEDGTTRQRQGVLDALAGLGFVASIHGIYQRFVVHWGGWSSSEMRNE
jgi:hypothetical protein